MNLSKTYNPKDNEQNIYNLWEERGAFSPIEDKSRGYFSLVAPPPNANANLHIGHALTLGIEDVAVRFNRLQGKSTLFVPGADHAGFETQALYEKNLAKEGKSRFDFSREELYQQIWDFVAKNREHFKLQFRQLGISTDWSKFTFTLDEPIVKRVHATFKQMWQDKLIYRGERLVNYCTEHRTGFADYEVEYDQVKTPLYYLNYGPFIVTTTRPETVFGDTAVAVHPKDKRYTKWIGKTIKVNNTNEIVEIRVVADEMVDMKFGTGVVKITPSHSFDDWEVAERHNLPLLRVINHDGTMNHHAGQYAGLTVLEARQKVATAFKNASLLNKVDDSYITRVGKCYKCGTVIEPMQMEQWFVNIKPLADKAIKALEANQITFYPSSKKNQLLNYFKNIKDWNISRQIAWGIPIPAFQNIDDSDDWIFDERVDEEIIEINGKKYRRDPDVFDTWFSSSSWPYATLNYPSQDSNDFFPLSLMETGGEILYAWVGRMIMLSLYITGQIPFKDVYVHGYVMAEDGSKMSKSKGNVIDPLEVIEKYGSDALRMGIISGRSPAVNRGYDPRRIEDARNFCNKLWNVARYIQSKIDENILTGEIQPKFTSDYWILDRLGKTAKKAENLLEKYKFSEAYELIYHFVWNEFADWYIEASKVYPNPNLLRYILEETLKMVHPFAPFVTESIWQAMHNDKSMLINQDWPKPAKISSFMASNFEDIRNITTEVRNYKALFNLTDFELVINDAKFIDENGALIQKLTKASAVKYEQPKGLRLTSTSHEVSINVGQEKINEHLKELKDRESDCKARINNLENRLSNQKYLTSAPKHIVEESKLQLKNEEEQLELIRKQIKSFSRH